MSVLCVLSVVTVASCSHKPVVVATWAFMNATKAGYIEVCLKLVLMELKIDSGYLAGNRQNSIVAVAPATDI